MAKLQVRAPAVWCHVPVPEATLNLMSMVEPFNAMFLIVVKGDLCPVVVCMTSVSPAIVIPSSNNTLKFVPLLVSLLTTHVQIQLAKPPALFAITIDNVLTT